MDKISIDGKEFELMLDHEQIKKRIRLIAIQLNVAYEKRTPVFIGVLNGSFMFMGDLMKKVDIASEISFVKIASYEGDRRSGQLNELIGLTHTLKDREVIVVEDIIDSGDTLAYLLAEVKKREPRSVAVCSLLVKPDSLQHEFEDLAYVGFEIEDDFVVGYGMDYRGLGRNFQDIYRAV